MHRRMTHGVLGALVALVAATGCSSGGGGKGGHDGGAAGHDAATDGVGSGGTSGAGGTAGGADAANDVSVEALADAANDLSADAADEVPPPIDAGADCIAPVGEAALSPASEGVPATGLVLWLRGDRGVYKTATQGVCAWADQSANHFVMTGTGARPAWMPTGLGGQAAIHFSAAGQQLGMGGVLGIAPKSARTFVAVSLLVSTTQRSQPVFQGQIGSPGTYVGIDENTFQTAGGREGVYATNNGYDAVLATAAVPRVHVYTLSTMMPGTPVLSAVEYRVNGATQTLTRTAGGLGNGNLEDFSGANATSVGGGADGILAEVLVYDRALSVVERGALETMLEARYGIQ